MYEIYAKLRDERGLTDYRVAKEIGISGQAMYAWKAGKFNPKIEKLEKIAALLGVPVERIRKKED